MEIRSLQFVDMFVSWESWLPLLLPTWARCSNDSPKSSVILITDTSFAVSERELLGWLFTCTYKGCCRSRVLSVMFASIGANTFSGWHKNIYPSVIPEIAGDLETSDEYGGDCGEGTLE